MIKIIKSHWIVLVILIQKLFDILHRHIMGIPTLKRSQISADLFLGGQYNLLGLKKLKQIGITAIVSMREKSIYKEAHFEGFKFLHLPTVDNTPPTLKDLIKGAEFVDAEIKNKGKVYIHCRQGLGRGPSMTIAYLLKIGTTYEDAFALVKSVRTFIDPRPMQISRLKELETYYKELASSQPD
ncbi:MAG: dual specificity protein phosphatase family protein [Bacteroidota bacterium]|nr:dual specificity protein phosphatase family protein [Bacteroidota bacterium]